MKIVCDSCGTKYSIADDKVRGKVFKIRCKKCSHIIVVRGGETAADPEAAAAAARPTAAGTWSSTASRSAPSPRPTFARKIERGEVKGDTYTWKEGFADWVKLSAVPEFAALVAEDVGGAAMGGDSSPRARWRPRRPTAPNGRAAPRARGGRCSVAARRGGSDVFAAPAASARGGGGDLFGLGGGGAGLPRRSRWPSSRRGGGRARRRSGREPDRPAARELGPVLAFEPAVAGDAGRPSRSPRRRRRARR